MIIMPMMLMLNTSAMSGHDTFGITLLYWRRSFFFWLRLYEQLQWCILAKRLDNFYIDKNG